MQLLHAIAVVATCATAGSALMACTAGPTDSFDPSGTYRGAASLVGNDGAEQVDSAEDDVLVLTLDTLTIGAHCNLPIRDGDGIGVDEVDDEGIVHYFGQLQLPDPGQSCTLPGDDAGAVTLVVSDGLITTLRAGAHASMDVSLIGTTASGGALTYRFSGFR